ncbi:hypothetical protein CDAR_574141 [Caerostris darwini]|uniref:Uncharacterized protein n=1 Tax=Caerostris darwini TaxID=1538125 RepID=A0AAV4TBA9_9ARAC|nr:hypothetical protein CDAR_574141 [Caerostris darwini]
MKPFLQGNNSFLHLICAAFNCWGAKDVYLYTPARNLLSPNVCFPEYFHKMNYTSLVITSRDLFSVPLQMEKICLREKCKQIRIVAYADMQSSLFKTNYQVHDWNDFSAVKVLKF